jgi:hypothetical protein
VRTDERERTDEMDRFLLRPRVGGADAGGLGGGMLERAERTTI